MLADKRRVRLVLLISGVLIASPVLAQSAGELRLQAKQVAAEIATQKAGGTLDVAAQQRAIERLGKLSLAFIELCDRVANSGGESRERDGLRAAYEAVNEPLEGLYTQNSNSLERMAKQVMDADGDLEALYDTPAFKDAQVVATHSLYYLNWLHFYGARLYDGAARRELLEKAQRGFSEFAVGDRRTELLIESLLGRGLCHLELGNVEFAVHDLQAVINDPQTSAERKAKARLALLDGYVRSGNAAEALKLSDQMLGSGGRAQDNLIRFLRARALLDAAKKAGGTEAERYRQQALSTMEQLRKAGSGWDEKVAALLASSVDDPEKWAGGASSPFAKWELAKLLVQKGDYKQAAPLLEGVANSTDADLRKHQGEAHYFLGLAKFQAGDYAAAAADLDVALQEDKPAYGADAAYLRFKALEALVAKDPGQAGLAARYEQAVRDCVEKYPDHKSAFEAQFRLGELLQAQGKFAEAIQAYAQVQRAGDAGFALRAQFATLQCEFELLQAMNQHTPSAERTRLRGDIAAGLQQFDSPAAQYEQRGGKTDSVPLGQMRAKVAVMKAVQGTLQSPANDQAVLDALTGFEKRFPDQQELLPQVTRLRLVAYQHLGRFADADAEVQTHGRLLLAKDGRAPDAKALEELAVGFVREGARRKNAEGPAANQAAEQVALRLYELLVADSEGGSKTKLTLARLYENTGAVQKSAALYAEVLQANGDSLAALRGLGRTAETEKHLPAALGYWQRLTKTARAGDLPWYEGSYEVARLTQATGKTQESCAQLQQLKPAIPGLSDADLRQKLDALYKQVCR